MIIYIQPRKELIGSQAEVTGVGLLDKWSTTAHARFKDTYTDTRTVRGKSSAQQTMIQAVTTHSKRLPRARYCEGDPKAAQNSMKHPTITRTEHPNKRSQTLLAKMSIHLTAGYTTNAWSTSKTRLRSQPAQQIKQRSKEARSLGSSTE